MSATVAEVYAVLPFALIRVWKQGMGGNTGRGGPVIGVHRA